MEAAEQRRIKARATWIEVFKETKSVSRTSRKCGVPRSTIYRWLKRYDAGGEDGLRGQSRRPKKLAKQKITQNIEKQILDVREKHKWGPLRIHLYFKQIKDPDLSVPTIWRVLKRNNVKGVKKYRRMVFSSNAVFAIDNICFGWMKFKSTFHETLFRSTANYLSFLLCFAVNKTIIGMANPPQKSTPGVPC